MRRLVVALVALLVLLVVADRVALAAADHVLAGRIQADQQLDSRPKVSIRGFPFLTQALGGTYHDVRLTLHDVRRGGVPIQTLAVRLHGVHVPLGAVLSQHLSSVPIDRADASALITYGDLNGFIGGRHLSVSQGEGGEIKVTGSVTAFGQTVQASGSGRLDVHGSGLTVTVGHGLDFPIPLGSLPFRIALTSAHANARGIVVAATANGLVVHPSSG